MSRFARVFRLLLSPGLAVAALALHLAIFACYARRWDKLAAITVFPFWAWGLGGMLLAGAGWLTGGRRRTAAAVFWLWLGTVVVFSDETRPLLRMWAEKTQPGPPQPVPGGKRPLRVVTLNCRAGFWNTKSLQEVVPWQPDIVLFQESSHVAHLQNLASQLYGGDGRGHAAGSFECGIVARGRLHNIVTGYLPNSLLATVDMPDGRVLDVACVHLQGAVTDVRLWTEDAFRKHWYNRQSRHAELTRLLDVQALLQQRNPAIIGGDFNAPAGDAVFRLLEARGFRDAFRVAGSGWPDTYPNNAPMLRIDHLWMNDKVTPVRAVAVKTLHSDHRMVVCDFVIP